MLVIRRAFFVRLCLLSALAAPTAPAGGHAGGLAAALALSRDGAFAAAELRAARSGNLAVDIIAWTNLRDGHGEFADYLDFITRNRDWPGLLQLRRMGEPKISPRTPADDVLAFFGHRHAQSPHGALYLARACQARDRPDDARHELVLAWRTLSFSRSEQAIFLREFPDLLTPHNQARLDHLLWLGRHADALRLFPFLGTGAKAEARARIALRNLENGVDALVDKVPDARSSGPGLAFERFFWRMEKGNRDDAVRLILARSTSAERLGRPAFWASARRVLARDALREGRVDQAYGLATGHHLVSGTHFADLEWLAGYIALTRLDRPRDALNHFQRFRAGVDSPISLGRAGYWEAQAYAAMDRPDDAAMALAFGAEFQTGFYGLLAAEQAGIAMDPGLFEAEPNGVTDAPFLQNRVLMVGLALRHAGETRLAARFFTNLAESLSDDDFARLGDLALRLDEPHIAVTLAKFAAGQGLVLPRPYFPVVGLTADTADVPPELTLSIIRRESEFYPRAVSRAGARGLMQLMPRTAKEVAGWLDLPYSPDRLLDDPTYNTTLGNAYLASVSDEFGGNILLIASGYNAGPTRTAEWIKKYGDPRDARVDTLSWIETIPFRETRNYVMRVAESVVIYRARLAGEAQPIRLSAELRAAR